MIGERQCLPFDLDGASQHPLTLSASTAGKKGQMWFKFHTIQPFYEKTLPEAQRTQGIESLTWIIFLTISNLYPLRDNSSFRLNCLGPLYHHLNWLQIWPPDGATCIAYKFSHQVALHA